jgi:ribonuclease T2
MRVRMNWKTWVRYFVPGSGRGAFARNDGAAGGTYPAIADWAVGVLSAILAVALAGPAHAAKAAPGDFDYYLLSLSVAPSFCALTPDPRTKPDCEALTPASFQQTPLTIHGLWPNRARVSVNRQPAECSRERFAVSRALQAELARYMPGGPKLLRHEWYRHGTCSGMSPDDYFGAAVSLAKRANEMIGRDIAGRDQVHVDALLRAVAAKDPATAAAIVVDCRQQRGGGNFLVEEIRLTLSKDLKPVPASSVGMGQNSGCPRGTGRIPAVPN